MPLTFFWRCAILDDFSILGRLNRLYAYHNVISIARDPYKLSDKLVFCRHPIVIHSQLAVKRDGWWCNTCLQKTVSNFVNICHSRALQPSSLIYGSSCSWPCFINVIFQIYAQKLHPQLVSILVLETAFPETRIFLKHATIRDSNATFLSSY